MLDGASIQTNTWTRIHVSRAQRQTLLSVNDVTVQGDTPEGTSALNSDSSIYLGGIPNDFQLNVLTQFSRQFQGCIQSFEVKMNFKRKTQIFTHESECKDLIKGFASITETYLDANACLLQTKTMMCTSAGLTLIIKVILNRGLAQILPCVALYVVASMTF